MKKCCVKFVPKRNGGPGAVPQCRAPHGSPFGMGKRSEGEKRLLCRRGPVIQDRQIGDVVRQQARQGRGQTPLPVGALGAGGVDAGFGTEVEPVRHRDDGHVRHAGKAGRDHGFGQVFGGAAQIPAGVVDILRAGRRPPALGGHIVVGAGVDDAVPGVGVRQVVARLPAIERELHDLHAGVAAGGQHGLDLRGQIAQVLGNDAALAQRFVHGVDEGAVRAFDPFAARCRGVPGGDGVVALEAAEVVDADDVINRGGVLHPALPPGKVLCLVAGPVVERVAPELAVGRKGIRRAAGHLGQVDLPIGLEKLRPGPEVAGIRADVDGDIAHQLDALFVGVGLEGAPLREEEELHGLVVIHRIGQPHTGGGQSRRLTGAQRVGPVGQTRLPLLGFQGHEQGVIVQPEVLRGAEIGVGFAGLGQKPVCGPFQDHGSLVVQRTVIHGADRHRSGDLIGGEPAVLGQHPVVDEVGVPGKGGKALVRAVAVAGGADGQDLPIGLSGAGQKIHESEGLRPQSADAEGTGQAEHRHQDTACAHVKPLLLTLDSAGNDALNDVFLAGDVEQDDGDDGDDDAGHHGGQLHAAVTAAEILDGHGDGAVLLDVQHQSGQQVVVPDPHRFQNGGGDHGRLQDGEDDLEEDLDGVAAVDHGSLFDLNGDALHEAGEHEHGQTGTEAEVDDADVPGGVQLEGIGRLGQGEHDHLEGDDHREDDEQVHELAQLVVHAGQVPARHRAAEQDEHHTGQSDQQAVAQAGEEVHLEDAVGVVLQADKGLLGGQCEDGGGGEGAFLLQTVDEDQGDGVDPQQAEQGHYNGERIVPHMFTFDHYCCTSLERVKWSWIMEMTTTMRKKITAFAWPMPFHCAPERP